MPPKRITERAPKVFFYVRCSTDKQDVMAQQTGIEQWLAEKALRITDTMIDEGISGTVPWQERKIGAIVDQSRKGDTIVVSEISRLGRVAAEVLAIINECNRKEVTVLAQKGNFKIDSSITGKMIVFMMAMMAELERDMISERTKQGMSKARAQGKQIGGRKPGYVYKDKVLDPVREQLDADLRLGIKQKVLAEKYKCSPAKLSGYIRKHGLGGRTPKLEAKVPAAPEAKETPAPAAPLTEAQIAAALRGDELEAKKYVPAPRPETKTPRTEADELKAAGVDPRKVASMLSTRPDNVVDTDTESDGGETADDTDDDGVAYSDDE